MSFFASKTTCGVCGKECGLNRYYIRASKAWCCPECFLKAGKVSLITPKTTIEQVKEYVARSQQAEKIEIVPKKPIIKSQTNENKVNNEVKIAPKKEKSKPTPKKAELTNEQKVEKILKKPHLIAVIIPFVIAVILFFMGVEEIVSYFQRGMISDAIIDIFFAVFLVVVMFVFSLAICTITVNYKIGKEIFPLLPELRTEAVVLSKSFRVEHRHTVTKHSVTFELPDGTRKNFDVSRDVYELTEEGDKGILVYKEKKQFKWFINFERKTQ